jgi:hypothetical protein
MLGLRDLRMASDGVALGRLSLGWDNADWLCAVPGPTAPRAVHWGWSGDESVG